jgi:DNA-binding protein H-NS
MMEQLQERMLREREYNLEEVQAAERERALTEIEHLMKLHEISIQEIQNQPATPRSAGWCWCDADRRR